MILEQLTKNSFGYYSTDLKPQSGKLIIVTCDGCGQLSIFSKQNYATKSHPNLCGFCARSKSNGNNQYGGYINIELELLLGLYYGNQYSISDIANIFECSWITISRRMNEHNISRRGNGSRIQKGDIPWNKGTTSLMPTPWNKGKQLSDEIKKKISETLKGHPPNSGSFKKGHIPWNRDVNECFSEETLQKMSKSRKGKSTWRKGLTAVDDPRIPHGKTHGMWKGGNTVKLYGLRSALSQLEGVWRHQIYERDNYTCQLCGIRAHKGLGHSVILEAHHILPFSEIVRIYDINTVDDAYNYDILRDIDNGITLCKSCHHKLHWGNS